MAFTIDKKKDKELRYIANKLQPNFYDANIYSIHKGKDLIAKGITEIQGKSVNKNETYKGKVVASCYVNHRRRLFKAYRASGNDGVVEYLKAYNYVMTPRNTDLHSRLI